MENSGNTKKDDSNSKLETLTSETIENSAAQPAQPEQAVEPESGSCGFDETGRYFVAKIDLRWGHLAIFGFLQNHCVDWLKYHMAAQRQAEQKGKLINPNEKKGWGGRFNLFNK